MNDKNIYKSTEEKNPFELLNTINAQKKNQHIFTICLVGLCGLLVFGLIHTAGKPPLVIRIDKLGNTDVVKDYAYESRVITEDDIKKFTKRFLDNYLGLRSDLVVGQLPTSMSMMTKEFAQIHLKDMTAMNTVKTIQAAGVRNTIILQKIDYEEAGNLIYVNVIGTLNTQPIAQLNAKPQVKSLTADLVLVKVERASEQPYGLLLKDINPHIDEENSKVTNNLNEMVKSGTNDKQE